MLIVTYLRLISCSLLFYAVDISLKLASCESSVFFSPCGKNDTTQQHVGGMGGTSPQKESKALLLYTNKVSKITNKLTKYMLVNTLTEVSELTN